MATLLTISKRLTHSRQFEPNGLSVVMQGVHDWALREGWKHIHLGLVPMGLLNTSLPDWIIAEPLPTELYNYYSYRVISDYIWPMLHGMPIVDDLQPDLRVWDEVGARLARRAIRTRLGAEDQIWVHDFQALSAIPLLSEAAPRLKIGYFQHAPLAIEGLDSSVTAKFANYLGYAGIVGVQTPDDAEAVRTLGVDPRRIVVAPVCTSATVLGDEHAIETGNERLCILIAGRCDPTKGHVLGIEAVERVAESSRIPIDLVVHASPSRTGSRGYGALRDGIIAATEHATVVLARYGGSAVSYNEVIPVGRFRCMMQRANCLLVPSFADGMNLIAKEYVVERGLKPSLIALTSRTGARYSLPGAFVAADNSVDSVAETLEKAILTNQSEILFRWRENRWGLAMETPLRWMETLANALGRHAS